MSDDAGSEAKRLRELARSDLDGPERAFNAGAPSRHVCFWAQQAVEKMLKSVLVLIQAPYPRTHDLEALRDLIPPDWAFVSEDVNLRRLTGWAVESRYEETRVAQRQDATEALSIARKVLALIQADVDRHLEDER